MITWTRGWLHVPSLSTYQKFMKGVLPTLNCIAKCPVEVTNFQVVCSLHANVSILDICTFFEIPKLQLWYSDANAFSLVLITFTVCNNLTRNQDEEYWKIEQLIKYIHHAFLSIVKKLFCWLEPLFFHVLCLIYATFINIAWKLCFPADV